MRREQLADRPIEARQDKPQNTARSTSADRSVPVLFFYCQWQRSPEHAGQAACKPGSVLATPVGRRGMAIPLGRPLPDASRDLPGRLARKPAFPPQRERRPYLVLLPVGFTVPPPL